MQLSITLRNGYNQTRSRGGDQLRVRVFNTSLQASAAGYVKDHNNGTYTAFIRTFWPGQQTISAILSYRRDAVRAFYYTQTKVRSQVRKRAKIRYRYNQVPHLTQDTIVKVTDSQLDIINESQKVSPFLAGDHKASINKRARKSSADFFRVAYSLNLDQYHVL